ncbi:hypothetical protein [Paraburkholderia lycopersici]|uniref:Uncharacterized protein n=1 Tax=Paraburkholderia lycopersici TaxID=416944 RepID=A0A1G6LTT4_9BURK|nr:hypothetical protein [Paraburkholderia lycopersici]SDC46682.1 hypothetical protein SAMN05421548_10740 [Paraburkholderia lycopersici]
MVYVFFCMNGELGPLRDYPSPTTREGCVPAKRHLAVDVSQLAETLAGYPGAVVVIGNSWPLYYDVKRMREACGELGMRIVNAVNTFGGTREQAVLDFMENRTESFVILASAEFEFSDLTSSRRVNVNPEAGIDEAVRRVLVKQLREFGALATRPVSDDEMLRATVAGHALRRAKRFISQMRARNDMQFQRRLRSLVGQI